MKGVNGFAMVCAVSLAAACSASTPESRVSAAREQLEKNNPAAAEIELKNALKDNPQLAEARYLLGLANLAQGDAPNAEAEFKRALELHHPADAVVPQLAQAMLKQAAFERMVKELSPIALTQPMAQAETQTALGNAHLTLGDEARARGAFETALARVPGHPGAQVGLARIVASNGDRDAAQKSVEAVLARAPNAASAWELKGLLLLADGRLEDAVVAWRRQIALEQDSTLARARLAGVLIRHNRPREAAPEVDYLKKHAPKLVQTHYLDALLAYRERRLDAAREAAGRLQKGAPEYMPGVLLTGLIEMEFRAYAQAQQMFRRVLAAEPSHSAARRALVRALLQDNQPLRAAEALQPLLVALPQDAAVAALAGEVYLQVGDVGRAMRELNRAARMNPNDAGLSTKVALTRFAVGRSDEGFAELEGLSQSTPGDARPDITLIAARLRARDYDKALSAIAVLEKKMPDSPLAANLRGAALLGKGDLAGARKSFERALEIRPGDFGASMNLAQLDLATAAPQAAVARFESMLAKDPKNLQLMMALADLRARLGASADEVGAILEKAAAAQPQEPAPRVALIALRLRNNDARGALAVAQQGLVLMPARVEMLDAAARAQEASGEINQAISLLQKIASLDPNSAYPHLRMAVLQARNKEFKSARESLRRAIDINPREIESYRQLIAVELASGQDAAALEIARKVQADHPKEVAGFLLETDVHFARKRWREATDAARAGLKVGPSSELALRAHSALLAQGEATEAARFAVEWMKAHPDDLAMPLRLGDLASSRGDFATARRHYQSALEHEPNHPLLLNNLAWVAGRMKDPAALEMAEKAHQLAPQSAPIKDTLGMLLVENGKIARGLELLQAASRLSPQDPSIRLNLARALIAAGKKPEARRELDKLAALGQSFRGQAEVAKLQKQL